MRSRPGSSSPATVRSSSPRWRSCCRRASNTREPALSTALVTDLTIFVLALLIGIEVIGKVPATLHTPLMSAANSIHGIVLVGALLIGVTSHTVVGYVLAFVASFFAAANVVGGYAVTGRMLKMFRRKTQPAEPAAAAAGGAAAAAPSQAPVQRPTAAAAESNHRP